MKKLLFVSLMLLGAVQAEAAISSCYAHCQAQNARLARGGSQTVVNCAQSCGDLPNTSQVIGGGSNVPNTAQSMGGPTQGKCVCAQRDFSTGKCLGWAC